MTSWLLRIALLASFVSAAGCSALERGSETTDDAATVEDEGTTATDGVSEESSVSEAVSESPATPKVKSSDDTERTAASTGAALPRRAAEVEVPSGTLLELELLTALDSSVSRVGDEIQARTVSPIYVKGELVLGEGAYVEGRVTEVEASGRVKGRAKLGFTFDRLKTGAGLTEIRTSFVGEQAESGAKKDATVIGGATGVGAIVGGIIGGKKGAAIGAAIGGAGGTGVVLSTKGEEIRLPAGTPVNVRLDEPVKLPAG